MAANEYQPATMKIDIWKKDMQVIGDFLRALGVDAPTFTATEAVYEAARSAGLGGEDTAAVCRVLEQRAGVKRE